MKDIQDKLTVWGQLYKQCEQLELHLRSAKSMDLDKGGPDMAAIEAELKALKARTDAAFKAASEALRRRESRSRPPGDR